jgi:predicted Zn-dependent protease
VARNLLKLLHLLLHLLPLLLLRLPLHLLPNLPLHPLPTQRSNEVETGFSNIKKPAQAGFLFLHSYFAKRLS